MKQNKRFEKHFGSLKVFVVYIICTIITLSTVLVSTILAMVAEVHPTEKLVEHISFCVLCIILLNVPLVMQARFRFRIPAFIQIMAEVFITAHFILGEVYRFYDYMFFFDKTLHIVAGVAIATLGFSIVYGLSQAGTKDIRLSPFFVALFSFCFSMALLALWEVFEYLMDSAFGLNMQRWEDGLTAIVVDGKTYYEVSPLRGSGVIDTMTDIIVGMIGAAAISVIGAIFIAKNPNSRSFFITKVSKQKGKSAIAKEDLTQNKQSDFNKQDDTKEVAATKLSVSNGAINANGKKCFKPQKRKK